jgi:SAM-dependent methyltransferase
MGFSNVKRIFGRVAPEVAKQTEESEGKWDVHFRQWIEQAEARGQDPNDVGDEAWANDYLAQVLERCYLRLVPKGGTVLELGPGSGRLTRHLIGRAGRIELIDNSDFVVKWISKYLEGKVDHRAVLISKPLVPHLKDNSIDAVLAHGVFEHLDFDETYFFLLEFCRVIKPGATISFNYDNIQSEGGKEWFLGHKRSPGRRCIFRFYTPDFIMRIAEIAGLKVSESFTSNDRLAHLILTK